MIENWFSICGRPILLSRSPQIHNHWFRMAKLPAHYFRLIADSAPAAVATYRKIGVAGFNVTAPFKQAISAEIDDLTPEARATGAVNLVLRQGRQLRGFNTDVAGVAGVLAAVNCPHDVDALVLGAGGAARAAIYALKQLTARITIVNRTDVQAQSLAQEFDLTWRPFAERAVAVRQAPLIIAAVTQTDNLIRPEWLHSSQIICDANYIHSNLEQVAAAAGCTYLSGQLWLEQQARQVFRLFTGLAAGAVPNLSTPLYKERAANLALIGFMGAGKSTLGKALAGRLGWQFTDTDELIEQESGENITKIFARSGEAEFRQRESAVLAKVLRKQRQVIACGGGLTIKPENRQWLSTATVVILLYARPSAIWQRIECASRPLLLGPDGQSRAELLFADRLESYLTTADAVLDTEIYTVNQAEDWIYAEIEQVIDH